MTITYRQADIADSYNVFKVFLRSIMDYSERMNVQAITGGNDPEKLASIWESRKPLFDFLARDASQFWVAERDGEILGYARTIEHDGLQELTEFFVSPNQQSAGIGSGLLSRAFADNGATYRTIIATLDERALYRYMQMGVYGRTMLKYFYRKAETVSVPGDLVIEPLDLGVHLEAIHRIDRVILNHARGSIHEWLAGARDGFVYKRDADVVGYGYVGGSHGPFAVLDDDDFPAVLAHAESRMAEQGEEFGVSVPLVNRKAIDFLTARKYKIDSFSALLMSNVPFGKFENYLTFAPEFFL
ncbi:MAG: GNAT family N-acetyltransferase [Anaerolineales bacterium]|nr:MAG: GNAT family N-acetyltransferase [Anaerolineales bacterium]